MKNWMKISFWLAVFVSARGYAQQQEPVLAAYLALKDALVASDAAAAASNAGELVKQLSVIPTANQRKEVSTLIGKVKADAEKIAVSKALPAQREAFTPLSANFFTLAKEMPLSTLPLYQFYCPMKKAVWLSAEKSVKNPYYGNQMLTCGSLQDTLN